ncbi:hypothetical protein PIB30_012620 [Stylosanthes scabra]|uniref:Uncharacterized protein n=1 Tax=Stylosanthes scabra TaxID=79078 RepID=A0ABU6Y4B6_9FABA|nr:hypothetical protein [Stylosanthes scabra]
MSPRTGPNPELGEGVDGMRSYTQAITGPSVASVAEDEQPGMRDPNPAADRGVVGSNSGGTADVETVCDRVSGVKPPAGENNACTAGTSAGRERAEVMHACIADVAMDACTADVGQDACTVGEGMDAGTDVVMADNTENLARAELGHDAAELADPACIPSPRRNVRRQIRVQADRSSVHRT